jgi:hypothetical protein
MRPFCSVPRCYRLAHWVSVVIPGACILCDATAAHRELERLDERNPAHAPRIRECSTVLDEQTRFMVARAERESALEVLQ